MHPDPDDHTRGQDPPFHHQLDKTALSLGSFVEGIAWVFVWYQLWATTPFKGTVEFYNGEPLKEPFKGSSKTVANAKRKNTSAEPRSPVRQKGLDSG